MPDRGTVVIVDQWALVRLGIGSVVRSGDFRVVGESDRGADGILAARADGASVVLLGRFDDMAVADAVRDVKRIDPAPAVVVLVERAVRQELAALFTAGANGVILRSADGPEVADAITRVLAGERVIAPTLLPALVGMVGSEAAAPVGGDGSAVGSSSGTGSGDGAGGGPVLTTREREVLRALAGGRSNREIAERLFVTEATVKTHLANLYSKLGTRDRHGAVARAMSLGLID